MKNNEKITFKGNDNSRDEERKDTPLIYVPVNDRSTEKCGY